MNRLPPIPIPPAQRWREFKLRFFPLLVFAATFLALAVLWKQNVAAPTLVGQVESTQADVISPDSGLLTNMWVTRFQEVKAGDVIAEVAAPNTTAIEAMTEMIRTKASLSQLQINSTLDRQRLAFEFQQLRLDNLKQQVDLATARVNLRLAERDLARQEKLFHENLISSADYDLAVRTKESLEAEVRERTKLIAQLDETLQQLAFLAGPETIASSTNGTVSHALSEVSESQNQLTHLGYEPVILRAPIDGTISEVHRRPGENILAGEPIVTIRSTQDDQIVGYIRQPFPFEPRVGMKVAVKQRTSPRQEAGAQILAVGQQFEIIDPALAHPGIKGEFGIPISISIPPRLKLHPGELVDISIPPQTEAMP